MYRHMVRIAFLLMTISLALGQTPGGEKDTAGATHSGIFPLPILFYTPETGIAGGAAVMYLYRERSSTRASSITGDVIYTQKKQIIVEVGGDQYFGQGDYRLLSNLSFQKYPSKFFGIGNHTSSQDEEQYTPQSFVLRAVLYRNFYARFNIGPIIRFESASMKETIPTGLLATGTISGSKGGISAGLGLAANWDSRDNTFSAHSGSFYQVTGLFYRSAFGSDYTYTDIQIDARNFFEIGRTHVLAVQAGGQIIEGLPPLQSLAKFGGMSLLRGYFDGRYRDKNGIALQVEYRLPVWWRFGMVGFAGIAQVADQINHFGFNRFWFAGGVGLRFFWNPQERISLRLDYGIGNNSAGMYVTVTEAF